MANQNEKSGAMGELRDLIKELNREDFGDFLLEKGVDQEVASLFVSNRISGSVFLKLTEDELKELIPTIGDRILVKELLKEVSQVLITCVILSNCIKHVRLTQLITIVLYRIAMM